MKKLLFLSVIALSFGCTKYNSAEPEALVGEQMSIRASVPLDNVQTRSELERNSETKSINVRWKESDKVYCFFKKEGSNPISGGEVRIIELSSDKKTATFSFAKPQGLEMPYTLYLVSGTSASVSEEKINIDVSPRGFTKIEDFTQLPLYGKTEISSENPVSLEMKHLGVLHSLTLSNYSSVHSINAPVAITYSGTPWFYLTGTTYDLVSESVNERSRAVVWQNVEVQPATDVELVQWVMPNGNMTGEIKVKVGEDLSGNSKSARLSAFVIGRSYSLYVLWNDGVVKFDEVPVLPIQYVSHYNVNEARNGFATSHDNDKCGGLFDQVTALNYLENVTWDGKNWHLPNKKELSCLVSTRVYHSSVQNEKDKQEVIQVGTNSKTFCADYLSSGNGVCYALRFKNSSTALESTTGAVDNSLLCAYRYSKEGNFTEGNIKSKLKVSVCYLGNMFEGSVEDIAKEEWWDLRKKRRIGYYERIIPLCGYKAEGGNTLYLMGSGGYIYSSSTHNGVNNWTRAYVMAFGPSGCSLIGEHNPGVQCAVRLFCDTPLD